MSRRVLIDPVTRVEGHLRVTLDAEPTGGGTTTAPDGRSYTSHVVTAAYTSATAFRGIEEVIRGRDPRETWHFASRVCGMCPTPHAIASVQAVEQALGLPTVPDNARLVRNMMEAAQVAFDHIVWFYQLSLLDYVDVEAAARDARPTLPSLKRLKDTLAAMLGDGSRGPFADGWWGHPAYTIPADAGLELLKHYVDALDAQAKAASAAAVLGGKHPMAMNLAPGGLTHLPAIPEILDYQTRMRDVQRFVDEVMAPDLMVLAAHYGEALAATGRSHGNFLTWGVLDGLSQEPYDRVFPRGWVRAGEDRDARIDPTQVHIYTKRSFYPDGAGGGRHPINVRQMPVEFTGLEDPSGKYDWAQAPRLGPDSLPAETGPLAQLMVAYSRGRPDVVRLTDRLLDALGDVGVTGADGALVGRGGPHALGRLDVLRSTLGRMVARVLKVRIAADRAVRWADQLLDNVGRRERQYFSPRLIPQEAEAVGAWDAPRGALAHWVRIRRSKVADYAIVAPSTWNLSPRDDIGVPGPLEKALEGLELLDPDRPLEALRVIHGFDPCMGCAVHVLGRRPARHGRRRRRGPAWGRDR